MTSLADRVSVDAVPAIISLPESVLLIDQGVDRVRDGVVEDSNSLVCMEAPGLGVGW